MTEPTVGAAGVPATLYSVIVSGWLNVAPGVVTQVGPAVPVSHAQLDSTTDTVVSSRGPGAKVTRSPNSSVCVASKPWLTTLPGKVGAIASYTTSGAA